MERTAEVIRFHPVWAVLWEGAMNGDTDWPARCQDYEEAIAELECVSRALKAALVDRGPVQEYQRLIDAEAVARERVVRIRTLLVNLRRVTHALQRASDQDADAQ